jgi:hypothetical protein
VGLLCELVFGNAEDLPAVLASDEPAVDLGGADLRGFEVVKVATLHALCFGVTFDSILSEYQPLNPEDEEGPWVFALPDAFVRRLAAIDAASREALADRWADADELALDGQTVADAREAVATIGRCAAEAVASHRGLLLWVSL